MNHLRVNALGAEKGRAGMPKVVKADGVGETRLLEEGLEGAAKDVVSAERCADGRSEYEAVFLLESCEHLSLF